MFSSGAMVTSSLGLCLNVSAVSSIGVFTCSTVGPMCACASGAGRAGAKVTCAELGPCCNTVRIAPDGCAVTGIVSCSCNCSCGTGGGGGGRLTAALGLWGSGSGGGGGGGGCGAS